MRFVQAAYWLAGLLMLLPCGIVFFGRLAACRHVFRGKAVIVSRHRRLGYGFTLHTPDFLRRLYPGRRALVIFAVMDDPHMNMRIGEVWPDIDVLTPRFPQIVVRLFGRRACLPDVPFQGWVVLKAVKLAARLFAPGARFADTLEIEDEIPIDDDLSKAFDRDRLAERAAPAYWQRSLITSAWYRLRESVPAPKIELPAAARRDVQSCLERFLSAQAVTTAENVRGNAFFYLRNQPRGGGGRPTSRDGAPVSDYLPAIDHLIEQGYRVFFGGDRMLDRSEIMARTGGLIDFDTLAPYGCSRDAYNLFAGMASDIAICDCGAGIWLPIFSETPTLVLHAFTMHDGFPNTTLYFRSGIRADGTAATLDELIALGPEVKDGIVLSCMDSDEILDTVRHFASSGDADRHVPLTSVGALDQVSRCMPLWTSGCGLSPKWAASAGVGRNHDAPGRVRSA